MKRDMDLVRKILILMEECPEPVFGADVDIEGYSKDVIHFHLMLMNEAGLIEAIDVSSGSDMYFLPKWITWYGYEFLEAAKDDTRWNKAKNIMGKTGGMLFDVLKELLKTLLTQELTGMLNNPKY